MRTNAIEAGHLRAFIDRIERLYPFTVTFAAGATGRGFDFGAARACLAAADAVGLPRGVAGGRPSTRAIGARP